MQFAMCKASFSIDTTEFELRTLTPLLMTSKQFGFVFWVRRLTKWQYKHFNAAIYIRPNIQNQKLYTFYCLWVYKHEQRSERNEHEVITSAQQPE